MQLLYRLAAMLALSLIFPQDIVAEKAEVKEQKFHAMLIWGTDGEKPEGKQLKEVEGGLTEKFRKIFKWKNYYQVDESQPFAIKVGETKHLKLSNKCDLKVRLTEKEGMQVELIGEGIPVIKRTQSMPLKDILIIAGDDKNATAWFVVLKPE
jgi:hypothetical protein